ncbi:MAG TPA: hypothetical protein VH575_20210 [Gemmataceae bacterium]|jgi:hypothetical protein
MSNDVHPLRGWFEIVIATLRREDLFLRNYLQPYSPGAYEYWEPGIKLLPEPVIHYLLLRELWSVGYPRALGWEHPYPDCPSLSLDLAIYRQSPNEHVHGCCPEHVIEVKIKRFGGNLDVQKLIWWDLLRLLWFDQAAHRYLLLLTIGPDRTLLVNDVDDLVGMRLGPNREQYSPERLISEVVTQSVQDRPYYLQHLDRVSEVLWDEFETCFTGNQVGRVRVSLIEVSRRS